MNLKQASAMIPRFHSVSIYKGTVLLCSSHLVCPSLHSILSTRCTNVKACPICHAQESLLHSIFQIYNFMLCGLTTILVSTRPNTKMDLSQDLQRIGQINGELSDTIASCNLFWNLYCTLSCFFSPRHGS